MSIELCVALLRFSLKPVPTPPRVLPCYLHQLKDMFWPFAGAAILFVGTVIFFKWKPGLYVFIFSSFILLVVFPCRASTHVFSCNVLLRAQNRTCGCLNRARLPDLAGRCCHFQILSAGTFFNIVLYDDAFGKRGSLWKEVVMDAVQILLSLLCLGYGVWAFVPVKYASLGSGQQV